MLYLIVIASLALTACEDNKDEPTKSRLDLKGFQIIRVDAETGGETTFSVTDYEKVASIQIQDQVGAGNYPPNLMLNSEVKCWENGDKENVKDKILDLPFTSPISIYKLLPEEVLFRPLNSSADNLTCQLYLKAYDSAGNKWRLENPFVGVLRDNSGKADIDIFLGKDELQYSAPDFPIVHKDDWDRHSLKFSNPTELGSYKLYCENFVLEDNSQSSVNYLDFEWTAKNKMNSVDTDSDDDQTCRFITYDKDGIRSGLSPYFVYRKIRIDFPKNLVLVRHSDTENEQSIAPDGLIKTNQFDISDVVSAETYPENLQIQATTFCGKNEVESIKTISFQGPTPLYALLPEEVLFQKHNLSSDSLQCTVEIKIQHAKAENRGVTLTINGTLHDTYQARNLSIMQNSSELTPPRAGEHFEINKADLHQYGLRIDDPQSFDRYQLVCETFSLGGQKARDNYFDLKQMDFSKAQLRNAGIPLGATERQLCRFFAYDKGVLVGYSFYFQLRQNTPTPAIRLDLSQNAPFLGQAVGAFDVSFNSSSVIGQLQITNPSDFPMYILLDLDDTLARLQWIGGVQGSTPQRVKNAKIYEAYVLTSVASGHQQMSNDNLFKVEGHETLKINYSLQRMEQCELGGGHVQGMVAQGLNGPTGWHGGATFGVQFEIQSPTIRLVTSLDPLDPESAVEQRQTSWSLDKGAAKATGFIYANDRAKHHHQSYVNGFQTTNAEVDNCRTGGDVLDLR